MILSFVIVAQTKYLQIFSESSATPVYTCKSTIKPHVIYVKRSNAMNSFKTLTYSQRATTVDIQTTYSSL